MKRIIIISLMAVSPNIFAAQETSNAEAIEAILTSLNPPPEIDCYHFTDEVPPEEFIGFPECDITPSTISGSVEVGAFFNTGDNDYAIAKAKSDLVHDIGKLSTNWIVDLFGRRAEKENAETGKKEYETTDQKWATSLQSNYTLEEGGKNYVFAYGSYETNRFNGFDYQASVAGGWGRRWYETENAYFDAEMGPGYKIDEIAETEFHNNETQKSTIIRAAATYERKLFETMEFKQTLSAEYAPKSGDNSKYKSVSSITTKLIESLALKFAFSVDHNTEVESNISNTRTETSLTLVFSI
ncbi:YdiY family protein [Thalassomonas sp. M1454]|uniref:DUF481 domain-containing protein n=1 Tax=Thalassomonas sp. M1454 TaxID=2594477 RepID=UPI00117FBDD5|nr:DUF481 domain-containing protein [Thalassomonas sp. M1454]TRX57430.1 DUF481 domain-containing protein [Thalassomonas sp. M1454]